MPLHSGPCCSSRKSLRPLSAKLAGPLGVLVEWIWGSVRYVSPLPLAVTHPVKERKEDDTFTAQKKTIYKTNPSIWQEYTSSEWKTNHLTTALHRHTLEVYDNFLAVREQVGKVSKGKAVFCSLEALLRLSRIVGQFDKVSKHVRLHCYTTHNLTSIQNLFKVQKTKSKSGDIYIVILVLF